MKELIKQALDQAFESVCKMVPLTKKDKRHYNITDVNPTKLLEFMKDNDIPEDAWFSGMPNSYDGLDYPTICYDVEIPTTDVERLGNKARFFDSNHFKFVYKLLIDNGYKRKGFNSGNLREFKDDSVYRMYIAKDFDRLERYFQLSFEKM